MTVIVESEAELNSFLNKYTAQESILIPIYGDALRHPSNNVLCLAWVYLLSEQQGYMIPMDHPDSEYRGKLLSSPQTVWTPNKKALLNMWPESTTCDIQSLEYLGTGMVTPEDKFYPHIIRNYYEKYPQQSNIVNRVIPLVKWVEFCDAYGKHLQNVLQQSQHIIPSFAYTFLNEIASKTLAEVERAGLKINPKEFEQHFTLRASRLMEDDFVHTQYHLYTTTGRPSNKFGGVNYAALNTEDGARKSFESRFGKAGQLISIDYEAYHLRLIAELLGWKLPATSIHEHFGKQYFHTSVLTPEQYSESKQRTFRALYGESESTHPFFEAVSHYKEWLWTEIQTNGFIVSPLYQRQILLEQIWDPNPAKVFNYLLQLTETEWSLTLLSKVLTLLAGKQSKVVLYTYDSILIDYTPTDGIGMGEIIRTMENGGKFPVRMYVGSDYHTMEEVTQKLI